MRNGMIRSSWTRLPVSGERWRSGLNLFDSFQSRSDFMIPPMFANTVWALQTNRILIKKLEPFCALQTISFLEPFWLGIKEKKKLVYSVVVFTCNIFKLFWFTTEWTFKRKSLNYIKHERLPCWLKETKCQFKRSEMIIERKTTRFTN